MEGVHARGDYDLTQHTKFSDQDLSYTDPVSKNKYMPHIVEASSGVGRIMLAILSEGYTEEKVGETTRTVLKIDKRLAPIKVAVFPLLRNKPELVKKAREVYDKIKLDYMAEFDDNGNIGKRYRRQDELGTPYCLTIDFDSLEKDDVTLRDRDTMTQERVKIRDLSEVVQEQLKK